MWFYIGVEVEQETSAPPPKENLGSAPAAVLLWFLVVHAILQEKCMAKVIKFCVGKKPSFAT